MQAYSSSAEGARGFSRSSIREIFMRSSVSLLALALLIPSVNGADEKPLTAAEAAKRVGEKVTVQMLVRASKDRLEKHKEIYLDALENFKDPKNLAVVITLAGAGKLKEKGIDDPAGYYKDKWIRVTGTVIVVEKVSRIVVDDPAQIKVVEKE
jgi:hypothetical protein